MKAISNALKGVTYHNPLWGESLYELCRRATSRHIDRPDEIINQQVVYMINSEMHAPFAAKDACTCLKRRLQMDHPQKQYLAIILTSKVLQECHAALGPYQGELLQEVAYILRTLRSSSPAAARTRQVAMDVLRHFGSAGGDAYRVARQQGGVAPVGARVENVNRDPAAVAAERASLLDEIKRMCEQAGASTEILNELILNKEQPGGAGGAAAAAGAAAASESVGLRKELLADVAELRRLFDLYMGQLANLTGPDAEAAMKAALEAVDQLDGALSLEKDVDAELKDLASKGQLPPPAAADSDAAAAAADGAGSSAAAAAAADEAAARVQSVNLIDLDDEPTPAAAAAPAAAAGPVDPFAPPAPLPAAAGPAAAAALDPFAPVPAAPVPDPFAPAAAAADHADPFAALAATPLSSAPTAQQPQPYPQPFPQPAAQQFAAPAAAAADPFAEPGPAWGAAPASSTPAAAPSGQPFPGSLPQQQQQPLQQQQSGGGASAASAGGAGSLPTSAGGSSSAGPTGGGALPGGPGGFMAAPPAAAAAAASPYGGAPVTPGYGGGFMPAPGQGMMGAPYGYAMQPMQQQMPGLYGMPGPYAGMTGGAPMYMPQPTGGPSPYGQPMMPPATSAYPGVPAPYPSPYPQQQQQVPQQPPQQQQQQPGSFGGLPAVQAPSGGGGGEQAVLSPTNPFASVAPTPVVGGVANPFQPPAGSVGGAAAAAANVEQEWNTFFSDRPGVAAAK